MSKHFSGGKFTRSHTTAIEAATPLLRTAERLPEVKKVVLGVISQVRHGQHNVKFSAIPGGLKVQVRGTAFVQIIYLYCDDPERTQRILTEALR